MNSTEGEWKGQKFFCEADELEKRMEKVRGSKCWKAGIGGDSGWKYQKESKGDH